MGYTESEDFITSINKNVFFKEFTFDKNEFYPSKSDKKELADNVLWLDDLLFILQIKERDSSKANSSVDNWFENKVLKKAKDQIKTSLKYLSQYSTIPITNKQNQTLDIAKAQKNGIQKLIVYRTDELLDENNRNTKFYESLDVGNIHIFDSNDYYWVCWYLHNPSELNEYLKFRERLYLKHKEIIKVFPEQYILSHFLNTEDETYIEPKYIETLDKLKKDRTDYDLSSILDSFKETLIPNIQKDPLDYLAIVTELAKLKRYELFEFKSRFIKAINNVQLNKFEPPLRYSSLRTECGFVVISLLKEHAHAWENALKNFTSIYKYKRKIQKCLGVVLFKQGEYFEIYWVFLDESWKFDSELEKALERENEIYGDGFLKEIERYKFE